MKKIKAFLIALMILGSSSLFAKSFDWSECWCNYGAGIKQGDMLLSIDGGVTSSFWNHVGSDGYWTIPAVIVDFEVAQPVWVLPFTFGGYVGFDLHGYKGKDEDYTCFSLYSGGIAAYHIQLPPENLDVYAATKVGFIINMANSSFTGTPFVMDFGEVLGASWFFNDSIGINLELGYPVNKFGVVFKF